MIVYLVHFVYFFWFGAESKIFQLFGLEDFVASHHWVANWKKLHRIVSRKATRVVSVKHIREALQVKESGAEFVIRIGGIIPEYGEDHVYNTDQSGFKIEQYPVRSLEKKGTKQIEVSYEQSSSATHSYTIQPTFSASGDSISPLLVVLPEKGGKFGVRVEKSMFKHPILYVKASKSGLVDKSIIKDWYEHIFFPNCGKKCLLLHDALTTYKDQEYYNQVKPKNVQLRTEVIPPGTTGKVQPCDVGIFRTFKSFHRKLSNDVRHYCHGVQVHARDNILRLIASTQFQISAPILKDFIRHSFVKCEYIEKKGGDRFEDPMKYCFGKDVKKNKCSEKDCETMARIRCAWCSH